jgi:very-short-patch-repair endonuclease
MLPYDRRLKMPARRLRREMTDAERWLWQHLRRRQLEGVQFYRQKPLGGYIVDFHAPAVRLVVEVDGGQHFSASGLAADALRTRALSAMGLMVLRYHNRAVLMETDAVVEDIWRYVSARIARG